MNWLSCWKGSHAPTELGTQGPLSPHPSLQNTSRVTDENWPPASLAFPPIGCQNIGGLSPACSWPWAPRILVLLLPIPIPSFLII